MATAFGTIDEAERHVEEGGYFSSTLLADADDTVRKGFIKKVYGLLSIQLLLTAAISYPIMTQPGNPQWAKDHQWLLVLSLFASIAILCSGMCFPQAFRTVPTNYFILFGFTAFEAVVIGFICGTYTVESVFTVFLITAGIFVALSVFAMTTTADFTGMGVYLFGFLIGLMLIGFLSIFIPGLQLIYCGLGAILFSFYIIYDTQMIVGGKHHKHSFTIDDYVFACITIYLDIVNLFLFLLELFGDRR